MQARYATWTIVLIQISTWPTKPLPRDYAGLYPAVGLDVCIGVWLIVCPFWQRWHGLFESIVASSCLRFCSFRTIPKTICGPNCALRALLPNVFARIALSKNAQNVLRAFVCTFSKRARTHCTQEECAKRSGGRNTRCDTRAHNAFSRLNFCMHFLQTCAHCVFETKLLYGLSPNVRVRIALNKNAQNVLVAEVRDATRGRTLRFWKPTVVCTFSKRARTHCTQEECAKHSGGRSTRCDTSRTLRFRKPTFVRKQEGKREGIIF
jgi:hypothetical protein